MLRRIYNQKEERERGKTMLYLFKIGDSHKANKNYRDYYLFETHTESELRGDRQFVIDLVRGHRLKPMNFTIKDSRVVPNIWPQAIRLTSEHYNSFRATYILLTKDSEERFKVINGDGDVYYDDAEGLKGMIKNSVVANCTLENRVYKSIDTYKIYIDINFEKNINLKYEEFRAKALLLGMAISFKYRIEGNDVNLLDYTGASKKVILPNFITVINKRAFKGKGITEININNGLRYIGNEAFRDNEISQVNIPETVEFIGKQAFHNNRISIIGKNTYGKNVANVMNSEALVIDNM